MDIGIGESRSPARSARERRGPVVGRSVVAQRSRRGILATLSVVPAFGRDSPAGRRSALVARFRQQRYGAIITDALAGPLGYGLILGWSALVSTLVDIASGGRTYPVTNGPDLFSRAIGCTWIGSVLLYALREARRASNGW
jgi:hypothetical protein